MNELRQQRAANGYLPLAASAAGEAGRPQEDDNTDLTEAQERALERLECAYSRARSLAVYHVKLADLFLGEAEHFADLLREAEVFS
mgnify:CR=1 FL=1